MADAAPQSPVSEVQASKAGPCPDKVQEEEPKLNGSKAEVQGQQENTSGAEGSLETKTEPHVETSPGKDQDKDQDQDQELPAGAVLCDSCIDSPRASVKSCLTCLVSYCEGHLRPHLENPKFSSHRLVEPLRDIERKTCEVHHCALGWFCVPDRAAVCEVCVREEHRGHELRSVEQARRDIERELKQKQSEMVKTVGAAENAITKLQNNTVSIEHSVAEARSVVDAQFEVLSVAVERTKRALVEVLEAEEKQAVQQADGIRVHLENRLSDLKKTQSQVQKISRNRNHLDFLQEYREWKADGSDSSLPAVHIGLMDSLTSFSKIIVESTEKLCSMMDSEFTERVRRACADTSGLGIKTTVRTMVAAKHNQTLPEPQTRADLLLYSKAFSYDPNTAHKFLRLTEENRKVTNTTPWQHPYEEHAERFEHWRQVLTLESIYLDRSFYELTLTGDGAYIGLAYKSLDRKGQEDSSCLKGTSAAWCLQFSGRSLSAWHNDVETPLAPPPSFSRLGVYVDYTGGRMRFYGLHAESRRRDGEAGAGQGEELWESLTLIHEFRAEFREPLYPAFWLPKKENAVTLVPPGEPLKSAPSPPTTPQSPPTNQIAPKSPHVDQALGSGLPANNANSNANNNNKVNGDVKNTVAATNATTITSTAVASTANTTATANSKDNTATEETGKSGEGCESE